MNEKKQNETADYVVLVDENNNEIGTALKSEVHTSQTPLHRAFSIYIFNSKGEVLTQQRSSHKKTWPLVWSNSCCGHPTPGEDTEATVRRRVNYELGLSLKDIWNVLPDFRYKAELDGIVEHEICPVFVAFTSKEPQPNEVEVAQVRWVPWQQFVADATSHQSHYSPWAGMQVQQLSQNALLKKILKKHTG